MGIIKITDIAIEVDEKQIARLLGYKNTKPDLEMAKNIQEGIKRSKSYFRPSLTYKKINITSVLHDTVFLENEVTFQGKLISNKLKECSYIVAYVVTIGKELDEQVKEAFDSGNYTNGLILEYIATEGLSFLGKALWEKLVDGIRETDIGITSGIFPGNDLELTDQYKIFECLKNIDLGVILNAASMMLPVKSQSGLYGFGEKIGIHKLGHVCEECNLKNCYYRKI